MFKLPPIFGFLLLFSLHLHHANGQWLVRSVDGFTNHWICNRYHLHERGLDYTWMTADINGDGVTDVLSMIRGRPGAQTNPVVQYAAAKRTLQLREAVINSNHSAFSPIIIDVDNDGATDFVTITITGESIQFNIHYSDYNNDRTGLVTTQVGLRANYRTMDWYAGPSITGGSRQMLYQLYEDSDQGELRIRFFHTTEEGFYLPPLINLDIGPSVTTWAEEYSDQWFSAKFFSDHNYFIVKPSTYNGRPHLSLTWRSLDTQFRRAHLRHTQESVQIEGTPIQWFVGDTDNDGLDEMILLSWERSQYHLSVYKLRWTIHYPGVQFERIWTGVVDEAPSAEDLRVTNADEWFAGEVNGDGRTDILHVVEREDTKETIVTTFLSFGDHFIKTNVSRMSRASEGNKYLSGDVNGDGLIDIIRPGYVIDVEPGNVIKERTALSYVSFSVERDESLNVDRLLRKFAPEVRLHSDEGALPASVPWYLENSKLMYDGTEIVPEGQLDENILVNSWDPNRQFFSGDLDLGTTKFFTQGPGVNSGQPLGSDGLVEAQCYAHLRPPSDGISNMYIQYWFFYPYNPQHSLGCGKHEGDWEHVRFTISTNGNEISDLGWFARHKSESAWDTFEKTGDNQSGYDHPIVYSAKDSHASYGSPGEKFRQGLPKDKRDSLGVRWKCWKNVVDLGNSNNFRQPWLNFNGRWGASDGGGCLGAGTASPDGPPLKSSWDGVPDQVTYCASPPPFSSFARPTSIELSESPDLVESNIVKQNFPNPFASETKISYHVTSPSKVKLIIYDTLGRELDVLVDDYNYPGAYEITWKPRSISSGIYLYKMTIGEQEQTRKLIYLKD